MTEPIRCTCHSISSTTAGVKIYICLRRLLLVCLSFKALLYYISNIWIARSYYLLYAKLLCPVPIFLFFHLLSYVVFTHVHRCVIFLMKKLVLERATRGLCSSNTKGGSIPWPGSVATSPAIPGRRIGRTNGLDLVFSGYFAKKLSTL